MQIVRPILGLAMSMTQNRADANPAHRRGLCGRRSRGRQVEQRRRRVLQLVPHVRGTEACAHIMRPRVSDSDCEQGNPNWAPMQCCAFAPKTPAEQPAKQTLAAVIYTAWLVCSDDPMRLRMGPTRQPEKAN